MIKNTFINYFFILGIIVNLVVPSITLQGINFYPVYFFSPIVFILWIYVISKSNSTIFVSKKIYYPLSIISFILISFFLPILFYKTEIYVKYFLYEILLYLVYIPFFLFFNCLSIKEEQIDKVLLYVFLIFLIVGVMQWLGYKPAITLYAFDSHISTAFSGVRLVLTGSDPNVGSIIASFFILYFLSAFLEKKAFPDFLLFILAIALLFKTQGRTSIIGLGIVVSLYLVFLAKIKVIYRVVILLLGSIVIIYLSSLFNLYYLFEGISSLKEGQNNSVNVRLDNADYAYDNFIASPIFGWGSALEHYGTVANIDSELFLVIQRYGLIGFIVLLSIIYNMLKFGFKYREKKLGTFLLLMIASLIFNMLTNVVFFGAQTVSIIVFLVFLTYFLERNEKNNLPSSITP